MLGNTVVQPGASIDGGVFTTGGGCAVQCRNLSVLHTYLLTCYKTGTHPVLGGYLDIWLVGKMLVKRVPIWCRIKFHCFYNFADEYYGESGVSATSYKDEGHYGTRNTKKGYNNRKTESEIEWRKRVEFNPLLQKKI